MLDSLTVEAGGDLTVNSGFNLDLVPTGFLTNAGTITTENNTDLVFVGTVNNSGTINVNSTGAASDIELRAATTLTGGGTVTFSGNNAGINEAAAGNQRLTNADNTIQGEGRLGQNVAAFTNQSLIDANASGGTLTLDPAASATDGGAEFDNNGTLRASNGGTLLLTGCGGGGFDNAGGTIEALAGSEVQLTANASVVGGTVRGVGDGVVRANIGQNVFFTDVTFEGDVVSDNNTDFGVDGTITNDGTITITSTGAFTDLEIQGATTLTGSGEVVLQGALAGINEFADGDQRLTHAAGHTIRGEGRVGQNVTAFTNAGLIAADVSGGTLTLDPAASATDGGSAFDNDGTLRASNGGTLLLTGSGSGGFDNAGGTIEALAGSEVQLTANASVVGGTVRGVGDGVVRANIGQNVFFTDVTFEGDVVSDNNTDFGVDGTITNVGTITIASTSSCTDLEIQGATTLTGSGEVVLQGVNAGINESAAGNQRLTNAAGHTIRGEGRVGQNFTAITNAGLVAADVDGGTLTLDPVASATDGGPAFANTGTLRASNGGTLVLTGSGGGTFNNPGTIEALADSTVRVASGATINQIDDSDDSISGGTYRAIDGTLNLAPSAGFDLRVNDADLEFSGAALTDLFDDAASAAGALVSQNFDTNDGSITLRDGVTLSTAAAQTIVGGTFGNGGDLLVGDGTTFAVTGGTFGSSFFHSGSLAGEGTVDVDDLLGLNPAATIAPGDAAGAAGTLTLTGSAELSGGATLVLDVLGSGDNDLLSVGGALTLGASTSVEVQLAAAFAPTDGERFLIADAADLSVLSGGFGSITDDSALYDFTAVYDDAGGNVFLQASLIPEPGTAALALAGLTLLARRRRVA